VAAPKATPAPTPAPAVAKAPSVKKLIFGSGGFAESNRFWILARPELLQFDPFVETLLEVDSKTGEFVPRLADKWEFSPDAKDWTFFLRKGVPFHYGYGEFTAKDVAHAHSLLTQVDSVSTFSGIWKTAQEVKAIDDYQVVMRMKGPLVTMPYAASRAGDLRMVSKAQWDKEGLEGFEKKPAGTGSYRYVDRKLGQFVSYESVENHWRGEKPDFKELEIRLAPEDATRLAMLLGGDAHIVDLPKELQGEALRRGMKILRAQFALESLSIALGGKYYIPGDAKFQATVPWADKRVRQAMNMAINRKQLQDAIYPGSDLAYVTMMLPISEGWNPEWPKRFNDLYGYNPGKAKELLAAAGYPPGALKVKIYSYVTLAKSEIPQVAEAIALYFKAVGIDPTIESLDQPRIRALYQTKAIHCCIWPSLPSWRPAEEWFRIAFYSKGNNHHFENEFLEKTYVELAKTVVPQERQLQARAIGDHLFESIPDIPLFWFFNEVAADPKVVAEWTYPGIGAGRTTHFHLIKATR
jgi:ABC-type transport system substrate-binding protein